MEACHSIVVSTSLQPHIVACQASACMGDLEANVWEAHSGGLCGFCVGLRLYLNAPGPRTLILRLSSSSRPLLGWGVFRVWGPAHGPLAPPSSLPSSQPAALGGHGPQIPGNG